MKIFAYILLWSSALIGVIGCSTDGSSSTTDEKTSNLETGWYYILEIEKERAEESIPMKLFKSEDDKTYHLNPKPFTTASNIQAVNTYKGFVNSNGIKMTLDKDGIKKWEVATEKQVRKYIGFVLNNELIEVQRVAAKDSYGNTTISRQDFNETDFQKIFEELQGLLPKDVTSPREKK